MSTYTRFGPEWEKTLMKHSKKELIQLFREACIAKIQQDADLTWTPCFQVMPDSDTTVMIYTPGDAEPVWMGYHDGEAWRTVEGAEITVTHWAPMIEPPTA